MADPLAYLSRLQYRESQLVSNVAKLPKRAKKSSEITDRLNLEAELEAHQRAIHKIKCALK